MEHNVVEEPVAALVGRALPFDVLASAVSMGTRGIGRTLHEGSAGYMARRRA